MKKAELSKKTQLLEKEIELLQNSLWHIRHEIDLVHRLTMKLSLRAGIEGQDIEKDFFEIREIIQNEIYETASKLN